MAGSQRIESGAIGDAPMKTVALHILNDIQTQKQNINYGFKVLLARKPSMRFPYEELINNALMIDDMERLSEYAQAFSRIDPLVTANVIREIEKYKILKEFHAYMHFIANKHGAKVSESAAIELADGKDTVQLEAQLKALGWEYDYAKGMRFPLQYCADTFIPQLEAYIEKYESSSDTYEIRKREAARELHSILVRAQAAMSIYEQAKAGKVAKAVVTPYSVQKQDDFYNRLENLRKRQKDLAAHNPVMARQLDERLKDLLLYDVAQVEKFEKNLTKLELDLDFLCQEFICLANQLSALQREMQAFTNKANESLWTFFRKNPHEGGVWLKELKNSSSLLSGLGSVLNSFAGRIAREQEKLVDEKFTMAPSVAGMQGREFLGKMKKTVMPAAPVAMDAKSSLAPGKTK